MNNGFKLKLKRGKLWVVLWVTNDVNLLTNVVTTHAPSQIGKEEEMKGTSRSKNRKCSSWVRNNHYVYF